MYFIIFIFCVILCFNAEGIDFNSTLAKLYTIVTFLPNETLKTFLVWSLQDEITEGIECLHYFLEPVDEFVNIPYGNETVTLCIEDDDRK